MSFQNLCYHLHLAQTAVSPVLSVPKLKKNQSIKLSLYKTVIYNCFETSWKCIETAGKDTFSPLRRWWRPNTELKIEIHLTLFHQVGVNPTVEVSCINRQCTSIQNVRVIILQGDCLIVLINAVFQEIHM